MVSLFKRYPVKVTIFEKRAGSTLIAHDSANREFDKKEGTTWYALKKKKKKTTPRRYSEIYMNEKAKNEVFLFSPSPDEYYPINLSMEEKTLRIKIPQGIMVDGEKKTEILETVKVGLKSMPENQRLQFATQLRRNYERLNKMSTLAQMLPIMMFAIALICVAIFLYISWQAFTNWAQVLATVSSNLEETAKIMAEALKSQCGTVAVNVG